MQRHWIAGQRVLAMTVMFGVLAPLCSSGCGSQGSENPVAQASAGQAAAKSSMDFMHKQHPDKKPGTKSRAKAH